MNKILLNGIIGDDITLPSVTDVLQRAGGDDLEITINSPGGDVLEGWSIYNAIKAYSGNITFIINGLCASMASIIVLAGDKIKMLDNSYYMVHDPFARFFAGTAEQLESEAKRLRENENQMIKAYKNKTGIEESELKKMLDEEIWLNADEALELAFVDEILTEGYKMVACAIPDDLKKAFNKIPELKNQKEEIKMNEDEKKKEDEQEQEQEVKETVTPEPEQEEQEKENPEPEKENQDGDSDGETVESPEPEKEDEQEEDKEDEQEKVAQIKAQAIAEERDRVRLIRDFGSACKSDFIASLIDAGETVENAKSKIITELKSLVPEKKDEKQSKLSAYLSSSNSADLPEGETVDHRKIFNSLKGAEKQLYFREHKNKIF